MNETEYRKKYEWVIDWLQKEFGRKNIFWRSFDYGRSFAVKASYKGTESGILLEQSRLSPRVEVLDNSDNRAEIEKWIEKVKQKEPVGV